MEKYLCQQRRAATNVDPHLFRRGVVWYARGGSLPRGGVSLKTEDREEAEVLFRELLANGPVGRASSGAETPLIDIVRAWIAAPHGYTRRSLVSLRNRLMAFGSWLAKRQTTHASGITPELMDHWIKERSAVVSRATINRDLRAAKVCLRWAALRGLCPSVDAVLERDELREPSRHRPHVVPSPAELTRVLAALCNRPRHQSALAVLWLTGLRIEELRHLHTNSLREGMLYVEPEAGADVHEVSARLQERRARLEHVRQELSSRPRATELQDVDQALALAVGDLRAALERDVEGARGILAAVLLEPLQVSWEGPGGKVWIEGRAELGGVLRAALTGGMSASPAGFEHTPRFAEVVFRRAV